MDRRTATLGFTLVEILVALVVTLLVVSGAIVAMQSQQRAYQAGQRLREAQDAGRRAALAIEQRLRHAGLGMDPALALDFSIYGPPGGQFLETFDPSLCPANMDGCRRDSTTNADELVFYSRDPAFNIPAFPPNADPVGAAWRVLDVGPVTVRLNAKPGDRFLAGQILVAICRDPNTYSYFTVAANTPSQTPAGGLPQPLDVPLVPVNPADPFRRQDLASLAPGSPSANQCFQSAYAFKVDRYRFHVRPVPMPNGGFEPYLVLDMGVDFDNDNAVTANDELLVASGVELVQFSYVFQGGMTAGATPGTLVQFPATTPGPPPTFGDGQTDVITSTLFPLAAPTLDRSVYFPSSWFPVSQSSTARLTNAQGNVQAVRVWIVSRSRSPDPQGHTNLVIGPGFTVGNFQGSTSTPTWLTSGRPADGDDRYIRSRLEITIPLPNMRTRAMSLN